MIRIEGLTKRYGKSTVVDGFDLQVGGGSTVALWGPNGAGKTTVLLCILGFLHYEGTVEVGGFDARSEGKRVRSLVGYVPQRPGFYDDLTVEDTLAFSSGLRRLQGAGVSEAVERVGLGPHRNKRVGALSGGMRQRLALAVALLPDPPVLLLDEPTSNLDAAGRSDLLAELARLRAMGKTVFFTSHRPEEVDQLADRVITMESGRIVGDERPRAAGAAGAGDRVEVRVPLASLDRALSALRAEGFRTHREHAHGPVDCLNGCTGAAPAPARPIESEEQP